MRSRWPCWKQSEIAARKKQERQAVSLQQSHQSHCADACSESRVPGRANAFDGCSASSKSASAGSTASSFSSLHRRTRWPRSSAEAPCTDGAPSLGTRQARMRSQHGRTPPAMSTSSSSTRSACGGSSRTRSAPYRQSSWVSGRLPAARVCPAPVRALGPTAQALRRHQHGARWRPLATAAGARHAFLREPLQE